MLEKVMKKTKEAGDKENKESLKKLIPIAEYVLQQMVEIKCPMGELKSQPEEYKTLALRIQQKFLDENVKWIDRHIIFQLVQQAVDFTKETTLNHLDKSFDFASKKLWKNKEMHEITLKDVDEVLKQ